MLPYVVACAVPVAGAVNVYQTVFAYAPPGGQDGIGSDGFVVADVVSIASVNCKGSDVGIGRGDAQESLAAG